MPPAKPSRTHRRASGSGLLARRKVGRPAWYIAMLSGASFSQPSTPWTFLPVSPFSWKPGRVVPRLVVEHQDLGAAADRSGNLEPARLGRDRSAVHADPRQWARPAAWHVVRLFRSQSLQAAVVVPEYPLPVQRVVPVLPRRDGLAGAVAEPALTVARSSRAFPVQSAPAIVGDPLGVRPLDDLAQDAGDVLVVVGAVDARDVQLASAIGLARAVDGEPVGVGSVEGLVGAVGVHAGEDEQAVLVGRLGQLAVEIAVPQGLRSMVERELAGVVGHDAAGVEDHPLDPRVSPVAPPPRDVVARRVDLGDIGLAPAQGSAIPGGRIGAPPCSSGCPEAGAARPMAAIAVVTRATCSRKARRLWPLVKAASVSWFMAHSTV